MNFMKIFTLIIILTFFTTGLSKDCPQNCFDCGSSGICLRCYEGYFLNTKYKCQKYSASCPICYYDQKLRWICQSEKAPLQPKTIRLMNQKLYLGGNVLNMKVILNQKQTDVNYYWRIQKNSSTNTYAIRPYYSPGKYLAPLPDGTIRIQNKLFNGWAIVPDIDRPSRIYSVNGSITIACHTNNSAILGNIFGSDSIWKIDEVKL